MTSVGKFVLRGVRYGRLQLDLRPDGRPCVHISPGLGGIPKTCQSCKPLSWSDLESLEPNPPSRTLPMCVRTPLSLHYGDWYTMNPSSIGEDINRGPTSCSSRWCDLKSEKPSPSGLRRRHNDREANVFIREGPPRVPDSKNRPISYLGNYNDDGSHPTLPR